MSNRTLYSVIWDESFWFPEDCNCGWDSLKNQPGSDVYYPDVKDLNWSLPLSLALLLVRYLWEILLVVPIGVRLGLSTKRPKPATPIPQLEAVFKKTKKPDENTIKVLTKQTDLTERQVEIWFRKRAKQDVLTPMQKFRECSWHLVFYTTYFIYGFAVLWKRCLNALLGLNGLIHYIPAVSFSTSKPYLWKTLLCWDGWPKQHVASDIYWYYLVELSFYWSLIFTLFKDNKRKDFKEMTIHHVATIILMYFSWMMNFVRIGSLVLLVHDAADTWLALAKMSIYVKNKNATDIFFGIFLVVWIASRLGFYPFVVLYSTTVEPYTAQIMSQTFGAHQFFNFFLYLLQVLHVIWSYLIFRIVYRKMIKGNVEDVRSDSEEDVDEDFDDDNEVSITKTPVQNGINSTRMNGIKNGNSNGTQAAVSPEHAQNGAQNGKGGPSEQGEEEESRENDKKAPNGRPRSPSKIPRARKD